MFAVDMGKDGGGGGIVKEFGMDKSNPSILKEISPEYSLEGLMLKLQYFDHLI